jgi:hypothetical protein
MNPNNPQSQGENQAQTVVPNRVTENRSASVPVATPMPQAQDPMPPPPVVPAAPAPIPQTQGPKSGSPLLIIAIILALVAVIVVIVYVIGFGQFGAKPTPTPAPVAATPSPTPDVTAGWQVFGSDLLGFRYPGGWAVSMSEGESGISAFHYLFDIKNLTYQYGPEPATISISYWDNPQLLDIPTFQKQNLHGMPIYKTSYTPANVGIAAGYYTANGDCEPVLCELYTVAYKNKIFLITLFQPSATQSKEIVDQILSTVEFTSAVPSATPTMTPITLPPVGPIY